MSYVKSFILLAVVVMIAIELFIVSGIYNVGADVPHWPLTARLIGHLRQRSIEKHASGIAVPDLGDPKLMAEGAEHYSAMCEGCHLAPGKGDSEIRQGLYPAPPKLTEHDPRTPAEQFWIIKHGVKLTAMPAWGQTHSDNAIWGLVAFVQQLPGMSPSEYATKTHGTGRNDHDVHHHHHDGEEGGGHDHAE